MSPSQQPEHTRLCVRARVLFDRDSTALAPAALLRHCLNRLACIIGSKQTALLQKRPQLLPDAFASVRKVGVRSLKWCLLDSGCCAGLHCRVIRGASFE